MRSIWNGAISFGLVNIPVKLFAAAESRDIKFNYLHDVCKTPIRYQKVCPVCEREVPQEEIVRGYEYEKGKYVVLKDEDFAELPGDSLKNIQIIDFVQLQEIDSIYFQKPYFLAPTEFGQKPYRLLYEALNQSGKTAVARVFLRTRETLACIRIYENCLLMETMYFPEEIRSVKELEGLEREVKVHPNELKMAQNLIDNLTTGFSPENYSSEYRNALGKVIEAKIEDRQIAEPAPREEAKIVDLMEALRASVEAAEQERKSKERTPARKRAKG